MVHFVGAGCGAPDLITLRGHRLLTQADVVIYEMCIRDRDIDKHCKDGWKLRYLPKRQEQSIDQGKDHQSSIKRKKQAAGCPEFIF